MLMSGLNNNEHGKTYKNHVTSRQKTTKLTSCFDGFPRIPRTAFGGALAANANEAPWVPGAGQKTPEIFVYASSNEK